MEDNKSSLEKSINECLTQLAVAQEGNFNIDKAERNAAMFLALQLQLIDYLADVELKSRLSKSEIERLEAEKYFEIKASAVDKKLTEVALGHAIAKEGQVVSLKQEQTKFEVEYKKWQYILNILKDGHIFFRGLSKKNNDF